MSPERLARRARKLSAIRARLRPIWRERRAQRLLEGMGGSVFMPQRPGWVPYLTKQRLLRKGKIGLAVAMGMGAAYGGYRFYKRMQKRAM